MNQKRGSNAGFSLVELIAIMAIMIIFAVGAAYAFNNTGGYRTRTAASVISSYLDSAQNDCMIKNTTYLTISNGKGGEADGYYYVGNTIINREPVLDADGKHETDASGKYKYKYTATASGQEERLNSNIVITYDLSDGTEGKTIEPGEALMLTFDRSSGSLKPCITSFNEENGAPVYATDSSSNELYCKNIYITGGSAQKTIKIYTKTGKHEIINSAANLNEDDSDEGSENNSENNTDN